MIFDRAYLNYAWLQFKNKVGWGLLEFIRLAQTMLLEPRALWRLMNPLTTTHPQLVGIIHVKCLNKHGVSAKMLKSHNKQLLRPDTLWKQSAMTSSSLKAF